MLRARIGNERTATRTEEKRMIPTSISEHLTKGATVTPNGSPLSGDCRRKGRGGAHPSQVACAAAARSEVVAALSTGYRAWKDRRTVRSSAPADTIAAILGLTESRAPLRCPLDPAYPSEAVDSIMIRGQQALGDVGTRCSPCEAPATGVLWTPVPKQPRQ